MFTETNRMNKHKLLRAKAAHRKMLKARAAAQAFNQSAWSAIHYRHGNSTINDRPIKDQYGKRADSND